MSGDNVSQPWHAKYFIYSDRRLLFCFQYHYYYFLMSDEDFFLKIHVFVRDMSIITCAILHVLRLSCIIIIITKLLFVYLYHERGHTCHIEFDLLT